MTTATTNGTTPSVTHAATSRPDEGARVRLQDVGVEVLALRGELAVLREPRDPAELESTRHIVSTVTHLLDRAESAARGDGRHRRLRRWWSGEDVETAYRAVHRAEAEIARLYDAARIHAATAEARARMRDCLHHDDLRRRWEHHHEHPLSAAALSKMIQIGHEAKDQRYAKIRRFRNIVLAASALIAVFLALFAVIVSHDPGAVPLCFPDATTSARHCPTTTAGGPSGGDVWIVLLLGLLGGSLAAAVSVRKIRGAPTPYNLATALALLKVPAGALTAVGALILIGGHTVPGLTALDSQEQILSFALVFGYAQQLFTGLIDRRAHDLVAGVGGKGSDDEPRGSNAPPDW